MGVTKRRLPRGPLVRVSREWKDAVLRWLRINERPKVWLAEKIGMPDSSGLTVLLEHQPPEYVEQETTTFGVEIQRVTGIQLPEELLSDDDRELLNEARDVISRNPGHRDSIRAFLAHLRNTPKKT